jgi:hypothetical protein
MEPKMVLQRSQMSVTGHNLTPEERSSHPHTLFFESVLILSSHLRLCISSEKIIEMFL